MEISLSLFEIHAGYSKLEEVSVRLFSLHGSLRFPSGEETSDTGVPF